MLSYLLVNFSNTIFLLLFLTTIVEKAVDNNTDPNDQQNQKTSGDNYGNRNALIGGI